IVSIVLLFKTMWTIAGRLNTLSAVMLSVANGESDMQTRVAVDTNDEIGDVARSFNRMAQSLEEQMARDKQLSEENEQQAWVMQNVAETTSELNKRHDPDSIARKFLSLSAPLLDACQAALYLPAGHPPAYRLSAAYALQDPPAQAPAYALGDRLIGQAALEKLPIVPSQVPAHYVRVHSALGEASPLSIHVLPVIYRDEVEAVVELASFVRRTPS